MNDNWIPEGEAGMNQNRIEIDPAILDGISAALKKMWEEIDRAKQAKPEPVEFWEGQLVEVYDTRFMGVIKRFNRKSDNGCFDMQNAHWNYCHPLCDPLIDQYKPLAADELIPAPDDFEVAIRMSDGTRLPGRAGTFNKFRKEYRKAIGWMPADGWGGE